MKALRQTVTANKEAKGMTITEVRRDLFALIDELNPPIAIIRNGKFVAMLVPPDDDVLVRFEK
jgi:hypothetical protein